jgi:hypothetical protein
MRAASSIVLLTLLTTGPLARAKTSRDAPVTAPSRAIGAEPAATPGTMGPGAPAGTAAGAPAAATSGGAGAKPEVPLIGDEPLPDWKPPTVQLSRRQALFLSLAPEVQSAQRMRQAGMWLASIGGLALLVGGVTEAYAIDLAGDIGTRTGVFDPRVEDQKDLVHTSAVSLFAIGGAFAATGMTLFVVGQHRIKSWHSAHPADPLPPLSGY